MTNPFAAFIDALISDDDDTITGISCKVVHPILDEHIERVVKDPKDEFNQLTDRQREIQEAISKQVMDFLDNFDEDDDDIPEPFQIAAQPNNFIIDLESLEAIIVYTITAAYAAQHYGSAFASELVLEYEATPVEEQVRSCLTSALIDGAALVAHGRRTTRKNIPFAIPRETVFTVLFNAIGTCLIVANDVAKRLGHER